MSFDSVILAAVVRELNRRLTGGRVDSVYQPEPLDIVIGIRNRGANHSLLISAHAQFARLHLTSVSRPNPKTPPNFCMALRKYLRGSRVSLVRQVGFDRIAHVALDAYDGETLTLVVEMMGKHSNIILLSGAGRILATIKPVGKSKNRYREILPGREYAAPPAQGKRDPLTCTEEEVLEILDRDVPEQDVDEPERLAAWLSHTFTGISPFLGRELVSRAGNQRENLPRVFGELLGLVRAGEFSPVLTTDDEGQSVGFYAFPTVIHPPSNQHKRASICSAADVYYSSAIPRLRFEQAKADFIERIRKQLEARAQTIEELESGLGQCEDAERFKQIGELILAQLNSIPDRAEQAVLTDYYDSSQRKMTVELDPRLSVAENAERYFRRYQKALSGRSALEDRLTEVRSEERLLRKVLGSADSLVNEEQIRSLTDLLESQGIRIKRQEPARADRRAVEFEGYRVSKVISSGWEILVGENSEANDYLLTRVARPRDYWVHVKASPSAHVIIRTNGKPDAVPPAVLYAAAELAVRHSDSRHSSLVPVDYTLRKYVRKPKGAPAGKAIYQNEKTIYVTPKV